MLALFSHIDIITKNKFLKEIIMKTEELKNKSYDELVQLQQDGKITLVEFIEAQPSLANAWKEWIDTRPISEHSADVFLTEYEDFVMEHQDPE